jgi:polysaccharide pyruvyl transferase WcaK-like protein
MTANPTYCLLGASDDTGNLGVTALSYATLAAVDRATSYFSPIVFDHGWGVRGGEIEGDCGPVSFLKIGLRKSRRYHRRESHWNTRWSARLGGLGNPAAAGLRAATVVFDISGGDSFTDLYGPHRFATVIEPKELCLELGRPLVLLPQTYGPFRSDASRARVRRVLSGIDQAWSRDDDSHAALVELARDDVDPSRLRRGVDLAFALPAASETAIDPGLLEWLDRDPVAGLNVSGLVMTDTDDRRFGLGYDYRATVTELLARLTAETNVLLVPHVIGGPGADDSDPPVLEELHTSLPADIAGRVRIAPAYTNPQTVKAMISQLDWFCGTRMHATVASLSSGVPSAALAYSQKTLGVFATCGQADQVVNPSDSTADAIERVWESYLDRDRIGRELATSVPDVVTRSRDQFRQILDGIVPLKGAR